MSILLSTSDGARARGDRRSKHCGPRSSVSIGRCHRHVGPANVSALPSPGSTPQVHMLASKSWLPPRPVLSSHCYAGPRNP